jgi:hypothetical protein
MARPLLYTGVHAKTHTETASWGQNTQEPVTADNRLEHSFNRCPKLKQLSQVEWVEQLWVLVGYWRREGQN